VKRVVVMWKDEFECVDGSWQKKQVFEYSIGTLTKRLAPNEEVLYDELRGETRIRLSVMCNSARTDATRSAPLLRAEADDEPAQGGTGAACLQCVLDHCRDPGPEQRRRRVGEFALVGHSIALRERVASHRCSDHSARNRGADHEHRITEDHDEHDDHSDAGHDDPG
jgi:hypothetical protein